MYVSIHGRRLGFDESGLLFDGRRVGAWPLGMGRGKTFYVDSNAGGKTGLSPTEAVPTLDEAFALCTANQGDVIVVMPKHAETISAAGGITHDVAGVSVVGLGFGDQRPTFTFGTSTAASYLISAAGAYVENLLFKSNISNCVTCFDVTASDAWLNHLSFKNNGTNKDFLTPIKHTSTTDNAGDGLRVMNCRWITSDSDDLEFIEINANLDGLLCYNNFVVNAGTASPLVLVAAGKILTGADIGWNRLVNAMTANELFFSNNQTTNTGVVHNNYVGHADVTGTHDLGADAAGFRLFNNLSTSVDNLSGFALPAVDVNL